MQIRKFTDIDIANHVTGQYYRLESIDYEDTCSLLVTMEGEKVFR